MTRARAFRVRLAALIAGVFVAGGAALLGVQYLLTRQLFQDRIGSIEGVCVSDVGEASLGACTQPSDAQLGFSDGTTVLSVSIAQTAQLSREVLSGLLGWSVVVLDTEPLEQELAMSEGGGTVMDRNGGQVITAGSGATLDDAVAAANRGMAPRRKAQPAPGQIIEMPGVSRPSRVS